MRAWRYSLLGAALVFAAGCGSNPFPDPQPVQQRTALQGFNSCGDLETYIEDTAVLDMKTTLEQYKQGYYGWWWGRGDVMLGAPEAAASDASSGSSAPKDYTTTNTQVAGVDEADFVKNDGTRIFVLSGDTLYINNSWPANTLQTVSTLKVEGYPQEMFLDEKNRIVVFSGIWIPYPFDRTQGDVWCESLDCGYWYSNSLKVTVIDVANIAAPKVTDEFYLPGYYNNARRVGSSVRLVVSDSFRWPQGVKWSPEYEQGLYEDKARLSKAYDALIVQNEKVIRDAKLEQWLPVAKRKLADGSLVDVGYQCSDFYKTNAPTKLGLVTVATLNLDNPAGGISRTSVVAEAGEVYASQKNLYVASRHWWWWPQPGQKDYTYLHKFDITHPDKAVYVASGGVDGHIVDQFSMDENQAGFFRVATTIATRAEDPNNPDNWWGVLETTNRVSVLGEVNGSLDVVGKSEDLAKGERIFSSRFMGDKGYVVTFRQVDPLFTFDLSDPKNPKKIGELKIPGFSSYIHPLDANHLLTIGTYIDENADWQTRSLQLSIFDVTDMKNPVQKFTHKVGSAYGWSEAAYEHKAFNYFPAKKLLAIPFWDYDPKQATNGYYWDHFVSDLRVFSVDAATGFTPKGSVTMKDIYRSYGDQGWTYYWSPWVRRSVMADDYVYAISDAGIRVANIADLAAPIATVQFGKAQP